MRRSGFAQWRSETQVRFKIALANRLFRKGERGPIGLLRRWMMPPEPDAPIDPDLEHDDHAPPRVGRQTTIGVVPTNLQNCSGTQRIPQFTGIPGGWFLGLVLAGGVFLVLGWPILSGRIYLDSDLGRFYFPIRQFYARALAEGWSLLWSPMQFSGFYLHGEGQLGLYHPANFLGYSWLPLPAAFSWELLRNYVFAFPGMFLFLRVRKLPRDASLMGALLFTFCAFNSMHFMHLNGVASLAHAPWELLMVHLGLRGYSARVRHLACIGLALLVSSTLMMGHPQFAWLALALAGLYTVLLLVEGVRWPRLAGIIAAVALGFLLAALQLLPQLEALGDSVRSDPGRDFVNSYSIRPAELTQYVQPYLFSGRSLANEYFYFASFDPERSGYPGCFAVLALLWIVLRGRRMGSLWPIGAFSVFLFVLATDLTLGFDGFSKHLEVFLPLVGKMRAPSRYLAWVDFSAALAVAIFFADLCRVTATRVTRIPRRMYALWLVPILSIAVAGAWYLSSSGYFSLPGTRRIADPQMLVVGVALVGLATSLIFFALRGWKVALYAIMVLAAVDVAAYGPLTIAGTRTVAIETVVTPSAEELLRHDRTLDYFIDSASEGKRVHGYVALTPEREFSNIDFWLPLVLGTVGPEDAKKFRNVMQVLSIPVSEGLSDDLERLALPSGEPSEAERSLMLPRARFVSQTQVSDDPVAAIGKVDVSRVGLTNEELYLDQGENGTAEIQRDLPGDIQIDTHSAGRQLLVLSEGWHQGWKAYVDGDPARIVRTYGDIMGVVVSGGPHEVEFKFVPESFSQGKALSFLGLFGLLIWLGVAFRPARRGDSSRA